MRKIKSKAARKMARGIVLYAEQQGYDNTHQDEYLQNQKTGQIVRGGKEGVYRRIKKMYRENVEVIPETDN